MAGSRRWNDRWHNYAESKPRPVDDGIATSKARGAMAESWWSKRFVAVLDDYGLGARMQRGKRYARSGQLLSFEVRPGHLIAQVQGSRATPYLVTVDARPPTEQQWAEVDAALASRVKFAARLLAGEVPPELEEVFADAGVVLLPTSWAHVDARCSCPDHENPCKHIAATLYVFADRLDTDPWMLLEWRGRTRKQILDPLVARGPDDTTSNSGSTPDPAAEIAPWWPLDPRRSWPAQVGAPDVDNLLAADEPEPPDLVLTRLDPLDVEIGHRPVVDALGAAYRIATATDTKRTA